MGAAHRTAAANKVAPITLIFFIYILLRNQLPIGKGCLAAEIGLTTYTTDKG